MGTSVLLVFIIPLMFLQVMFTSISGAIFGYPTAEIALPYDEEKGIVWEYDNVNDPNIELVETKVENGEQIFVFEGKGEIDLSDIFFKDEDAYQGEMMDLVFTDKNGNQKLYYGYNGYKIHAPQLYPAEECQIIDVTVTAEKPRENASWEVVDDSMYILMKKPSGTETETFTTVITPSNKDGEYNVRGNFDVRFAYTNSFGNYLEEATVFYEFKDGAHTVKSITYETLADKWLEDLENALGIKIEL